MKLEWWVEYQALRSFELLVRLIPRRAALALGSGVGRLAAALRVGRSVVEQNMRHVAIVPDQEIPELIVSLYRNMGRYIMDVLRTRPGRLPPYRITKPELLEEVRSGGATLALLAHFGNFELLAAIFGERFDDIHVIVKPQHNVLVERWLENKRHSVGVGTIYQKSATRRAFAVLRRGGVLGALIDQHPGVDGTEASFLGKPAITVRAIAGLKERTGIRVGSAYAILREDGVYDLCGDVDRFEPPPGSPDPVQAIQERHNDIIGEWVREHPDHWFGWFHRRFRPYIDYSK